MNLSPSNPLLSTPNAPLLTPSPPQGMSAKDYMYDKSYDEDGGVEYPNNHIVGNNSQQIATIVQVNVKSNSILSSP